MTLRYRPIPLRPILPPYLSFPTHLRIPRTPAVPFYRDPKHTVPTKWSLYRSLLRFSKSSEAGYPAQYPEIRNEIKRLWRKHKSVTSIPRVQQFLNGQYDILSAFQSDESTKLNELESRLKNKRVLRDLCKSRDTAGQASQPDSKPPRLTGGYLRPTLFNPPLPRLKPQPIGLSMMIHNRLRKRERRMEKRRVYASLRADLKLEVAFWRATEGDDTDWSRRKDERSHFGWDKLLREEIGLMDKRFIKENMRSDMIYDSNMMRRVQRAKTRKLVWWKGKKEEAKSAKRDKGMEQCNLTSSTYTEFDFVQRSDYASSRSAIRARPTAARISGEGSSSWVSSAITVSASSDPFSASLPSSESYSPNARSP